jgi:hypothetical protein
MLFNADRSPYCASELCAAYLFFHEKIEIGILSPISRDARRFIHRRGEWL